MKGSEYAVYIMSIVLVVALLFLMFSAVFRSFLATFFWTAKSTVQNTVQFDKYFPATTSPSTQTMQKENVVRLTQQNNSYESGSATLQEVNGKVVVTVTLVGSPEAVVQPAHIHMGVCPTPGAVKYPLSSVTNGKSSTTLDVSLSQLMSQLPLAINVHKSAADIKTYVACGNLAAQ